MPKGKVLDQIGDGVHAQLGEGLGALRAHTLDELYGILERHTTSHLQSSPLPECQSRMIGWVVEEHAQSRRRVDALQAIFLRGLGHGTHRVGTPIIPRATKHKPGCTFCVRVQQVRAAMGERRPSAPHAGARL